jgi:hypothetical protein
MTEILLGHISIDSQSADEFIVRIEPLPDGKVSVSVWPGLLKALIVTPGSPTKIKLQMPYTPDHQQLRLEITQESST